MQRIACYLSVVKAPRLFSLAALAILTFISQTGHATEVGNQRTFGLGVALGAPSSLVGKLFIGAGQAIDFGVSFSRYGYGRCWNGRHYVSCNGNYSQLGVHADYLWQDNLVHGEVTLDWHIGVGGRLWALDTGAYDNDGDGSIALAARMPVGLDLTFQKPSFLELFVELVPTFYVVPGTGFDIEAALGARFYF